MRDEGYISTVPGSMTIFSLYLIKANQTKCKHIKSTAKSGILINMYNVITGPAMNNDATIQFISQMETFQIVINSC
jgi:hypothetical protein